ncbi:MAG: cation:proton antiporter [Candidatus Marsarchaeota archaeon]|nr:cation:proton antiporter [Candidatus Marsarchaeota archaeon]
MEILMAILILVASATGLGLIVEEVGIPHVVGEIGAGIILGPALLNFISYTKTLSDLASVALFFIVLLIGIEATTDVLIKHYASAAKLTVVSFIVPSSFLFLISHFIFGIPIVMCAIISIAVGVPSISIVSILILKYGLLHKEGGQKILVSVVFSDILAFVILAVLSGNGSSLMLVIGLTAFSLTFFALDFLMKRHARELSDIFGSLRKTEKGEALSFSFVIIAGLVIASLLQLIGVTYVLGAFFAGLLISRAIVGARLFHMLKNTFRRLNNSFFIPLCFSIAGLEVSLISAQYALLLIALLLVSTVSVLVVGYEWARIEAHDIKPTSVVALLGGRGAVGVAIGSIALSGGLISDNIYSIIVIATVCLSTILPPLLRGQRPVR